jgi:hypothetical protein
MVTLAAVASGATVSLGALNQTAARFTIVGDQHDGQRVRVNLAHVVAFEGTLSEWDMDEGDAAWWGRRSRRMRAPSFRSCNRKRRDRSGYGRR